MSLNKSITISALITLMFILTSCTTTPYTRHKSPNISGLIHINGQAAKGIQLFLTNDGDDILCRKHKLKTSTDPEGQFNFSSIKEKMAYTPLVTHYLDEWVVCIEHAGSRYKIYSDNRYGQGSVIESVNLKCDFINNNFNAGACSKPLFIK